MIKSNGWGIGKDIKSKSHFDDLHEIGNALCVFPSLTKEDLAKLIRANKDYHSQVYLNINNEQAGPFDVATVNQMLTDGQITQTVRAGCRECQTGKP